MLVATWIRELSEAVVPIVSYEELKKTRCRGASNSCKVLRAREDVSKSLCVTLEEAHHDRLNQQLLLNSIS